MEKTFEDIDLVCFCGANFTWEKGEQEFMQNLMERECVAERKKRREVINKKISE